MIYRTYNRVINYLSFAKNLRALRSKINVSIDVPEVIEEYPNSHPRGFIKEFKKRRTTIVETYLRITKSLDSSRYSERVQALSLLAEHIVYSRSLKMPLNAARVQLGLMKEVVKNRNNKRAQLELMYDFTVSSFGHPRSIRKYLKKLDIIEVPETGEALKDLKMGWDFHVHDSTSYGRKKPIQLIIDTFIKGISEITIAYNNLDNEETIKEVLEAGRILGIKVNIALEFSALTNGHRFHYMYILPNFSSKKERFKKFLKQKTDDFKEFLDELEANEKKREKNIKHLIENFNQTFLPRINEGYTPDSIYYLHPLSAANAENTFGHKINSRRQLGEFLYPKLKRILEKRALHALAIHKQAERNPEDYSQKEIEIIRKRYLEIKIQFQELEPEKIRIDFFTGNEAQMAETAVSSLEEIYELAKKSESNIKFIQPLEHGVQAAVEQILENYKMLTHTEVYNTYETIQREESEFVVFTGFIKHLNEGSFEKTVSFLDQHQLKYQPKKVQKAIDYIKQNKLIPAIGSDAAGWSTLAPGMGFVLENRLPEYQRKYFSKTHKKLPDEISQLIFDLARIPKTPLAKGEKPRILTLGRLEIYKGNMIGDEKIEKPIHPNKVWEYLNPSLKNLLFIILGFVPAYLTIGLGYTLLWFFITGFRNMFVDVISGNGFKPKEWRVADINWENLAQSLFWSGISVPVLGYVKSSFDIVWTGSHQGVTYELLKFFFINFSNGIYLAAHNYMRGFDKQTIQGNFFRSIIAWPLAVIFSPLGNVLNVPSIVQAKFWSDFVGAFIEGRGKYKNIVKVKDQLMIKLVPDLLSEDNEEEKLATLDMIYFINESTRVKTAIYKQLFTTVGKVKILRNKITRKKPSVPNQIYFEIKNRFNRPNHYQELVNYIIEHYNQEQRLYLINLLALNYSSIKKWINKMDM